MTQILPGCMEMFLASRMASLLKAWRIPERGNIVQDIMAFTLLTSCPSTCSQETTVIPLCNVKFSIQSALLALALNSGKNVLDT